MEKDYDKENCDDLKLEDSIYRTGETVRTFDVEDKKIKRVDSIEINRRGVF